MVKRAGCALSDPPVRFAGRRRSAFAASAPRVCYSSVRRSRGGSHQRCRELSDRRSAANDERRWTRDTATRTETFRVGARSHAIYPPTRKAGLFSSHPRQRSLLRSLHDRDATAMARRRCWWLAIGDRRNLFGIREVVIPGPVRLSAVFWWPRDNDVGKFAETFSPSAFVRVMQTVNSGPDCAGPSYPDGLCQGYEYSPAQLAAKRRQAQVSAERSKSDGPPDSGTTFFMSLFIVAALLVGIFRPSLLKRLAGVVDATPEQLGNRPVLPPPFQPVSTPTAAAPPSGTGFGRKQI